MIIEYIKKLLHKWFGKFSLIASFSGVILFYTGIDTNNLIVNFIVNNLLSVSLIFLLISAYQVWSDIRQEKQILEEKLKNPIDYEIKATIKKVVIDIQYLENIFDKNIEKTKQLIDEAENEIDKLSVEEDSTPMLSQVERLRSLSSTLSGFGDERKTDKLYLSELISYKHDLREYPNKKDSFLLEWKNFIDNDLKNIYYANFNITNIGTKSDEDIDVEILFKNENRHIDYLEMLNNFPKKSYLPIKPKRENNIQFRPTINFDSIDLHNTMMNSNPQTYKRYEEITDTTLSVKLRDLKVSETVRIFRKKGFFIFLENKDDFDVNIVSKNSNSAIHKKLIFEKIEDYDYFKEAMHSDE